jgi:hypothetical protein
MSKTTLQKLPPAWHAQIAVELIKEFCATHELSETAKQRRARLGFMFIFVKEMGKADKSIPHSEFGPWLERNCPSIPRSTAGDYITEAKSLAECLRWEISEIRNFAPHKLLIAKPETLSNEDRERRELLVGVISSKGKFRAITQYRQAETKDDETVAKRGRLSGEGGRPAELKGTIEEVAAALKKSTRRHCFKAGDELEKAGINFIGMDDGEITACAAAYERTAKCMNAWLAMPAANRDAKAIQKLWKTL